MVESAAFAFVFSKSPKGPDTESIGPLYVVVLVGLSGMMVADIVQMLTTTELDEARWQDNRKGLMDKVRVTWIDGGLKKSLKEQTRISVRLE
ncbi:hypothetical protein [Acaryochloris marina]|nr:hypothetical protein [Acaryochloris marina]